MFAKSELMLGFHQTNIYTSLKRKKNAQIPPPPYLTKGRKFLTFLSDNVPKLRIFWGTFIMFEYLCFHN